MRSPFSAAFSRLRAQPSSDVHAAQVMSTGDVEQDTKGVDVRAVRTTRLRRSLQLRKGQPAFTNRAIAKHLGVSETLVRLMLRGERHVADHHVERLPPSVKEDVLHGTPSERNLRAGGIRIASDRGDR